MPKIFELVKIGSMRLSDVPFRTWVEANSEAEAKHCFRQLYNNWRGFNRDHYVDPIEVSAVPPSERPKSLSELRNAELIKRANRAIRPLVPEQLTLPGVQRRRI